MPRSNWVSRVVGWDRPRREQPAWLHGDRQHLLPTHSHTDRHVVSTIPAAQVTKVALKLRHLVESAVPCDLDESEITRAHSSIITPEVVQAAKEAGGSEYRACVVFCLLICKAWFRQQSVVELWDADLHRGREVACEVIAKKLIETEDDTSFLLHNILLQRYSILVDGEPTYPANAIERAVDLHAVDVITSSGYQKCVDHLWRGWLVQDEDNPTTFVDYANRDKISFFTHLDPDRIRVPRYQNATQLLVTIAFLVLFTVAVNTPNPSGRLDVAEVLLYLFTLGFICNEVTKVYKAGYRILGFWNAVNGVLYTLITASFVLRMVGLGQPLDHGHEDPAHHREFYRTLSYNFLAFSAPLFWCRLLLYLDTFRFFGAMLVVLKVMMKESLIFFALLAVVIVGFLQAFIGLDIVDDMAVDEYGVIIKAMANAVMQSPEFDTFGRFSPPFGTLLYYFFTFIVMVILLNVLIALYNSAYEDIYQNADAEFLALFAHKTLQFVRAPDENVYIPPFNLVEIVLIALFGWWMPAGRFEQLNDAVMSCCYAPVMVAAAAYESNVARAIHRNRARGGSGDDYDDVVDHEWERVACAPETQVDFEAEGWDKVCEAAKSDIEVEPAVQEVRQLRAEVEELKRMLAEISRAVGAAAAGEESK
ncbi:hypothetical protein SODALDRAFT_318721 [Sodiomyces alkalinus F11]|uniref:Uncharacterized protein n=1 Tax=Sodiomyces alkalinus (strain CBS 110278 / VKM F-3762 / F11) TaxID=1314773 RepID=A0A3N2Q578_SODAK|nr:hypothetical protein SODALDRAFT_318721 [Sodiomyces alkalinus F11]ROT41923.1 hypothetical protein SODALDRAFT_318721 [Sodiomyces alkalinus F11]